MVVFLLNVYTGSEAFVQSTRLNLDKSGWYCQSEDGWWQQRRGIVVDRQLAWTTASDSRCINAKKASLPGI